MSCEELLDFANQSLTINNEEDFLTVRRREVFDCQSVSAEDEFTVSHSFVFQAAKQIKER